MYKYFILLGVLISISNLCLAQKKYKSPIKPEDFESVMENGKTDIYGGCYRLSHYDLRRKTTPETLKEWAKRNDFKIVHIELDYKKKKYVNEAYITPLDEYSEEAYKNYFVRIEKEKKEREEAIAYLQPIVLKTNAIQIGNQKWYKYSFKNSNYAMNLPSKPEMEYDGKNKSDMFISYIKSSPIQIAIQKRSETLNGNSIEKTISSYIQIHCKGKYDFDNRCLGVEKVKVCEEDARKIFVQSGKGGSIFVIYFVFHGEFAYQISFMAFAKTKNEAEYKADKFIKSLIFN